LRGGIGVLRGGAAVIDANHRPAAQQQMRELPPVEPQPGTRQIGRRQAGETLQPLHHLGLLRGGRRDPMRSASA
jgi:hypothetical protein